ncbi:phosphotransferase family protein [Aquirufa rosea]|uniref:Phosphotransferase family protein n=1 Tax=Aquirufa rosea TaxID=2509241 RepID=A0A4Q1C2U2_9BACT|nr:phosphotransferase family protein [Aquirufa rosea]RXK52391.1 phosphotransferase family protein [Aquirufa rosea]
MKDVEQNASLWKYLSENLGIPESEWQISPFRGGFSNLTFGIEAHGKKWVLRRPPLGKKISKAHDMVREFRILQALEKAGYHKIPKPILCCEDESIWEAPFFVMEHVEGPILRNKMPEAQHLPSSFFRHLSAHSLDVLLELHQLDLDQSGLGKLGKSEGYMVRQVTGWADRYDNAQTEEILDMSNLASWLKEHIPTDEMVGFIHNDFKYDNLVLSSWEKPEVIAVLDWEMATVGDPRMDLGTLLAYWAEAKDPEILKMFNLSYAEGNFTREEVIEYYAKHSSISLDNVSFYYAFGLFKVGVIAQQIYQRHLQGFAPDSRFAELIHVVKACAKLAIQSILTNRI